VKKPPKRPWIVAGFGHRSIIRGRYAGNVARLFARKHGLTLQSHRETGTFKGVSLFCLPL
jgi:hypothetical protein